MSRYCEVTSSSLNQCDIEEGWLFCFFLLVDRTDDGDYKMSSEAKQWCRDNVAANAWSKRYSWIMFRHPHDAMAFKLRWC